METTTKPDGTKIQTETKKEGTKVETTIAKDGSTSKTTTNPNGSSVTENKAADGTPAFSDVAASAYYAEAVKWATGNGITNGIGNNLFGSDNDCTRAQIVTFLYRAYQGK